MEKVTFFQSIIKILSLISSIPFFIEALLLTLILLIFMIIFYFKKSKVGKVTTIIIYFVTLALLPITYFSFFIDTIDDIIQNFVSTVYFPSSYFYIAMVVITNVVTFILLMKNSEKKWYKAFNFVYFFIFQLLFFIAIRIVITDKINIFEKLSIYSNPSLTSVVQVTSYIFWIRIGILIVKFIINSVTKFELKKSGKSEASTSPIKEEDNSLQSISSLDNNVQNNPNDDFNQSVITVPDLNNAPFEMNNSNQTIGNPGFSSAVEPIQVSEPILENGFEQQAVEPIGPYVQEINPIDNSTLITSVEEPAKLNINPQENQIAVQEPVLINNIIEPVNVNVEPQIIEPLEQEPVTNDVFFNQPIISPLQPTAQIEPVQLPIASDNINQPVVKSEQVSIPSDNTNFIKSDESVVLTEPQVLVQDNKPVVDNQTVNLGQKLPSDNQQLANKSLYDFINNSSDTDGSFYDDFYG